MGSWKKLRVIQTGGIAGNIEAPLVALERDRLSDEHAQEADRAVAALTGAPDVAAEPQIGADLPSYRVEVEDEGGARSLSLAGPGGSAPAAGLDVPQLLARLSAMPQAAN